MGLNLAHPPQPPIIFTLGNYRFDDELMLKGEEGLHRGDLHVFQQYIEKIIKRKGLCAIDRFEIDKVFMPIMVRGQDFCSEVVEGLGIEIWRKDVFLIRLPSDTTRSFTRSFLAAEMIKSL